MPVQHTLSGPHYDPSTKKFNGLCSCGWASIARCRKQLLAKMRAHKAKHAK